MHGPITTTAAVAAGSAGWTLAALFPEATPAVLLCSLAGSALYVTTSDEHSIGKQIVLALISFIGGIYCAEFASAVITGLVNAALSKLSPPVSVQVSPAVGALVAAVICVGALLRILTRWTRGGERENS